ncbi:MAG: hypothetical protein RBT66_07025 [bacterium]|nr:hypothetical protein [Methanocellales archaeon]MDX9780773.1 hypothetical protein [bacterium]
MSERFDAIELRRLEIAETECPWGEAAANLRMLYLADVLAAGQCAKREDAKRYAKEANEIAAKLFGRPQRKAAGVAELIRQRKT